MGTEIPPIIIVPPVPAGDGCIFCWGPGKTFGDIDTPSEIVVNISGVNLGPLWIDDNGPAMNGEYTVPQDPVTPCIFELLGVDDFRLTVTFGSFQAVVALTNEQGHLSYLTFDSLCSIEGTNNQTDRFVGGTHIITLPETQ